MRTAVPGENRSNRKESAVAGSEARQISICACRRDRRSGTPRSREWPLRRSADLHRQHAQVIQSAAVVFAKQRSRHAVSGFSPQEGGDARGGRRKTRGPLCWCPVAMMARWRRIRRGPALGRVRLFVLARGLQGIRQQSTDPGIPRADIGPVAVMSLLRSVHDEFLSPRMPHRRVKFHRACGDPDRNGTLWPKNDRDCRATCATLVQSSVNMRAIRLYYV